MGETGGERMILEPLKLPELKELSLSPERDQVHCFSLVWLKVS